MSTKKHSGSCHCEAVKFVVEIDATRGSRCNCSICTKLGGIGAIAKPEALVVEDESACSEYRWGGMTGTRYFCKQCGIHCFGKGHLAAVGGDYVSVNLHCLDDVDVAELKVVHWDGRHNNWQAGPRDAPWPIG